MFREEDIAFSDLRRLRSVFVGFGVWELLGRISRKGARPRRGMMEAIWNTRG